MRYWAKTSIKEVSKKFNIPTQTARDWEKLQNKENWRSNLLDKLKVFATLQDETTEKLIKLFTQNELKALWGSLKSTMIDMSLIENVDYLKFGFADYCIYEEMEASQFGDIKILSKSVSSKLGTLDSWERYCLLEFIQNKSKEIFEN